MALLYSDVCNLLECFLPESEGKETITLGRLNIYLHRSEIARLRKRFKQNSDARNYFDTYEWGEYHERLFTQVFKCGKSDSLDFSSYEGATVIHDLQQPIPNALRNKYDLVLNGGTLEHVFDIPAALSNLIRLARIGGMVYSHTPCNNLSGHGFYQLSPELPYRTMCADNGMSITFVRIGIARFPSIELSSFHRVYDVVDPAVVGARVRLLSSLPTYIMFMACKTADIEPFSRPVLQSDYVQAWRTSSRSQGILRQIFRRLPQFAQHRIAGYRETFQSSLHNKKHYQRVR